MNEEIHWKSFWIGAFAFQGVLFLLLSLLRAFK